MHHHQKFGPSHHHYEQRGAAVPNGIAPTEGNERKRMVEYKTVGAQSWKKDCLNTLAADFAPALHGFCRFPSWTHSTFSRAAAIILRYFPSKFSLFVLALFPFSCWDVSSRNFVHHSRVSEKPSGVCLEQVCQAEISPETHSVLVR